MRRLLPDLPRAKAHWTHRASEVPDFIIVPMSDGTVVRFVPEVVQPGFVKAMNNIKNMAVGYRWKGEEDESTL